MTTRQRTAHGVPPDRTPVTHPGWLFRTNVLSRRFCSQNARRRWSLSCDCSHARLRGLCNALDRPLRELRFRRICTFRAFGAQSARCRMQSTPFPAGIHFLGNVTGYAPAYSSVDNQGCVLFVPLVHGCGCSGWREMVHVLERVQLDGWLPYIMTLGCSGISRTLLSTLITLT